MADLIDLRSVSDRSDEEVPDEEVPPLAACLEALLLLSDEPLGSVVLAEATRRPEPEVIGELRRLSDEYRSQGRGFELRQVDGSWRFYTSDTCREAVTRFVTDGRQAKLTQAALETLAIVAYRQPASRAQVGAIRGVNCDGVIRTLVSRGLIAEVGEDFTTGASRFGTTTHFLDRMGIGSVDELPPIADHLPDLDALDGFLDAP